MKDKKIVKRKEVKYSLDEWKQINICRQSIMDNNISASLISLIIS